MRNIFIYDYGTVVSTLQNRVLVKKENWVIEDVPIETLESINIFSKAQVTTQCILECAKRGIGIVYYTLAGDYVCELISGSSTGVTRQRKQALVYDSCFSLDLGKKVISDKIKNQYALMRRKARDKYVNVSAESEVIQNIIFSVERCRCTDELIGYEGIAAKTYFSAMEKMVNSKFTFRGRTHFPPEDKLNSLLSLGYSLVTRRIESSIRSRGLNPYFGFIHRDRNNHPSLASDLIEEWRPIIVDSFVFGMVNRKEITTDLFEEGTFRLNKNGFAIFNQGLNKKLDVKSSYMGEERGNMTFTQALLLQIDNYVKAIENNDIEYYIPIRIR